MTIITDLVQAIETYPHESLVLEIIAVDPPGDAVNTGEDVRFRIQAANSGPLDVNDLTVLVEGLNGTEVKKNGAAAVFVSSFTTVCRPVPTCAGPPGQRAGPEHGEPISTSRHRTTRSRPVPSSCASRSSGGTPT